MILIGGKLLDPEEIKQNPELDEDDDGVSKIVG